MGGEGGGREAGRQGGRGREAGRQGGRGREAGRQGGREGGRKGGRKGGKGGPGRDGARKRCDRGRELEKEGVPYLLTYLIHYHPTH